MEILILLTIVNVALCAGFFLFLRFRFSPRRLLQDVERELDLLYKDLQQEVDTDISLIEDRSASLRKLIATADKRILLAASEIEKRNRAASFSASGGAAENPSAASSGSGPSAPASSGGSVSGIYTRRAILEKAAGVTRTDGSPSAGGKRITPEMSPRERVLMLARKDISPDAIASLLSLPRSEVEMILDLER